MSDVDVATDNLLVLLLAPLLLLMICCRLLINCLTSDFGVDGGKVVVNPEHTLMDANSGRRADDILMMDIKICTFNALSMDFKKEI